MIIGILGILKAGGAYVPFDSDYPDERLNYIAKDTGIRVLLTQTSLFDRCMGIDSKIILLDSGWEKLSHESKSNLTFPRNPSSLVYVIYTSGSTGVPKGVQISHRGLINRIKWMQEKYKLGFNDKVLQKTPLSFDVSGWELFWPILEGSQLVIAPVELHKDPAAIDNFIGFHGVTVIHFVPSMLKAFMDINPKHLDKIRLLVSSGETLAIDLFEKTERKANNLYGPTEASIDVTYYSNSDSVLCSKTVPIGRPISNIQVYILDDGYNLVPIGVKGELYIGGIGIARGYLNRPDLTAERFIANPFGNGDRLYRTGDLGRFLPDGNIEFLGRIDNQVKVRGFRIELGEIESTISKYVKTNVVLVKVDENESKHLVSYVVPKTTDNLEKKYDFVSQQGNEIEVYGGERVALLTEEIRNGVSRLLPDYMQPSFFLFLSRLPLTPNGKIDAKLLENLEIDKRQSTDEYVAPRNDVERKLCEIWQDVLQIDKVGINDNFFGIGGDSIIAIQVVAKLKYAGYSLKLKDIFTCKIISELAAKVILKEEGEVLFDYSSFTFGLGDNEKQKIESMLNRNLS
jgi:amino acid adenylation domain-containing protein